MNFRISVRYILPLILIMIISSPSFSQVTVERSKDKAVIAGVTYYIHQVKKGETIYSISRAYGITPGDLVKENPDAAGGLKEGQTIRIPASIVSSSAQAGQPLTNNAPRDETRFIYHILQPGETIYSLSKKYSVSENDILKSNPGIDITKLPSGFEVAIPRRAFMTEKKDISAQDQRYYYHKVQNGETLASIARKYGITLRALRRENRDTRFPQVGDYLKIPGMKPEIIKPVVPVAVDTLVHPSGETPVMLNRSAGYTPVTSLSGSVDVAVLLPFYLNENRNRIEIDSSQAVRGKKIYRIINRPDDWIYPRSLGFVEMYEGILLAADTLSSLGLNVNIHTFDITDDTTETINLVNSGALDRMNLIIGPVYSRDLAIVASYAKMRGIPVVSPVQLYNNSVLLNNPTLFLANSSLSVAQGYIARKMRDYAHDNIVLVYSDSLVAVQDSGKFRNMILGEVSQKLPFDEIKLRELIFYSRSIFSTDSINRLSHALSDKDENMVIIASENGPVMSESITDLHTLSRKYNIKVFGYPNMRYLDNLNPQLCFDLGLMVYSPYWIDYSRPNVKQFLRDFRDKFLTEPSEMSYAWQGYDIAYYFISGLALHGIEFIRHPEIHNPELLQTEFDFRQKTTRDGFENQKLFLVRYSSNYELELVSDSLSTDLAIRK